jgi:hypothetical protein
VATRNKFGGEDRLARPIEAPDPEGRDLVIVDGETMTYREYRQTE